MCRYFTPCDDRQVDAKKLSSHSVELNFPTLRRPGLVLRRNEKRKTHGTRNMANRDAVIRIAISCPRAHFHAVYRRIEWSTSELTVSHRATVDRGSSTTDKRSGDSIRRLIPRHVEIHNNDMRRHIRDASCVSSRELGIFLPRITGARL